MLFNKEHLKRDIEYVCDLYGVSVEAITLNFYSTFGNISLPHCTQEQWEEVKNELIHGFISEPEKPSMESSPLCIEDVSEVDRDVTLKISDNAIIFGIPDIHAPFHNVRWLSWVVSMIREATNHTDTREVEVIIIQLGDALDQYTGGKYEKCKQMNLKYELETGLKVIREMWSHLSVLPRVKCFQLIGNHDERIDKLAKKTAPELRDLIPRPKDILNFKNVTTFNREADVLTLKTGKEELKCTHGWLSKSMAHYNRFIGSNVLHAHLHNAELNFIGNNFCLNAGCGIDINRFPFAYTRAEHRKNYTNALARIDVEDGIMIPTIIPFKP